MNNYTKLISVFLKLDYRDSDAPSKKRITRILLTFLLNNTVLSFLYFRSFDEYSYAVLCFSVNILILSFIILNEYSNLFFNKKHIEIIFSLPVNEKELFISKYISAFIYILLILFTAVISQAVFYYLLNKSPFDTIVFVISDILFSISVLYLILIIYALILYYFNGKANYLIYFFQFLFLAFVVYTANLSSGANITGKSTIMDFEFVKFLPQNLYALSVVNHLYLLICLAITIGMSLIYFLFLERKFIKLSRIIYALPSENRRHKPVFSFKFYNNFIADKIIKNNLEKSCYELIRCHLRNSRIIKFRFIPLLILPVIFCLFGIIYGSNDLIIFSKNANAVSGLTGQVIMLSPSILITIILCLRLLVTATSGAEESGSDVNWIYKSIPLKNRITFLKGMLMFHYINFTIPLLIIVFFILVIKIEAGDLILNLLYIFTSLVFINAVSIRFSIKLPFSVEVTKYDSAGRLIDVLINVLFGAVIFILMIFIFKNIYYILIYSALLLTIPYFLTFILPPRRGAGGM